VTTARRRDDGFTLLETAISLTILGVVLASLTLFFVQATRANRQQADAKTATQLLVSAMDRVSQLPGASLLAGRTQAAVVAQPPAPGVDTYLDPATTQLVWQQPGAIDPTGTITLPTAAERVTIGGVLSRFSRSYYVGACWRTTAGGDCVVVPPAQQAARVHMYRVVVAITWSAADCPANTCSSVAAMLHGSDTADPTFGL
jgi:prepilin-type N-terminal cleavage/methylation domain-containing protein